MATIIEKLKAWWRWHNDPICRECGLGYQEAREAIAEPEKYRQRAYDLGKAEGEALDLIAELKAANISQREMLVMLEKHFVFLKRVAESREPLKNQNGKIESKYKVIATESEAAFRRVQQYLKENP